MKTKILLFICSFCFLSRAYTQKVISLHPLFTEQDALLLPEIEGLWSFSDFELTLSFQKAGDNFYLLNYGSKTNPSTFEAVFMKINDELFLDLNGVIPDTLGDADYRNNFVSAHSLYKVKVSKDSLMISEINYSWFYDFALKIDPSFKFEWVQNAMLLTLKTEDLKTFFSQHSMVPALYQNPFSFGRKHVIEKEKTKASIHDSTNHSAIDISQKCAPEFPFNDGWLGGDGDVSVPINSTTSLFIFSDSYVGSKNQTNRTAPGMQMVSNTVAVETCLPNGTTEMNYFWRNMYSEFPEPIFKTFTNRYKFWVVNAFMHEGNLYVVLQKVGPKLGVSPHDVFSFSLLGFTLAKVSNPLAAPNQWKIEYIPLTGFGNPDLAIGPQVKLDNYIYFFVSRNDKAQVLVRKSLEFLDHPEKPFEYYALNHTWKAGLDTTDMDTLVHGFRSNTVCYHSEMKQWVMICDVKFLDNKIKMRTAPALTGPWSDEKIIYEIPEVTPGNAFYNNTNFCYLPRECPQNYDAKNHIMLLTYDINNSDFSKISSNKKIYTPKVIKVSLKEIGK